MNEDTNQLTETFSAHEHLAPDAAEVLAEAHGIARSYQRRRWAVRATGGAVLGAGLVVGGIALPGRIGQSNPSGSGGTTVLTTADDPTPTPTPTPKKGEVPPVPSAAPTAGTVVTGPGGNPGGGAPQPGGCLLGALLCGAKAVETS